MGYEITGCDCPVCGARAEYNCIDDTVYCERCKVEKRRLRNILGNEYEKIKARARLEELLARRGR